MNHTNSHHTRVSFVTRAAHRVSHESSSCPGGEFPAFPQLKLRQEDFTVHFYNIWGWFRGGIPSFLLDGRSAGLSGPVIRSIFEAIRSFPTADIQRRRHRWQRRPERAIASAHHFLMLRVDTLKNCDLNKKEGSVGSHT